MKKLLPIMILLMTVLSLQAQTEKFRSGIFLHQLVGGAIWGPNSSSITVPTAIDSYNNSNTFLPANFCSLDESFWPSELVTNEWGTWKEIFNNTHTGANISQTLIDNKIVMIKTSFTSSAIPSWGVPSDTLNPLTKSVYNYKWFLRKIVKTMSDKNLNYFVIWTNPPMSPDITNATEANNAHLFSRWLKDTLARGLDVQYGRFPLNVYVFDYFHKVSDASSSWTLKPLYYTSSSNSLPNAVATQTIVPQLVQEVFNNSIVYEKYYNPGLLTVPVQVAPNDAAINQALNLSIKWRQTPATIKYYLEMATDTGFTEKVFEKRNIIDTSYSIGPLAYNTSYYWHVKSANYAGETAWSASRSFTTIIAPPGIPPLIVPLDSAKEQDLNLTFSWRDVSPPASTYRIQISKNVSFSQVIFDSANITNTLIYVPNKLDSSTSYYWRVKGINIGGESNYSPVRMLTTKMASPTITLLSAPANNATNLPLNVTLSWFKSPRALSYQVQLAIDDKFNTKLLDSLGISDTNLVVTSLMQNGSKYYWRARAKNYKGLGPWSASRAFTTVVAAPSSTTLSSPNDGQQDVDLIPVFTWHVSPLAELYHFQLSTDASFTQKILENDVLQDTSYTSPKKLTNLTAYFWRVRCTNISGISDWTPTSSFTTINYLPGVPVALTPADSAVDVPVSATFTWSPVPIATRYHIQIAEDFQFYIIHANINSLITTEYVSAPMKPLTKYYWRISSINPAGESAWSPFRTFVTGEITGVDEQVADNNLLEISPNPVSSVININVSLKKQADVRLALYNVQGELVSELFRGSMNGGKNNLRIDLSQPDFEGLTGNSVLFCKLQAGNCFIVKKLVLCK